MPMVPMRTVVPDCATTIGQGTSKDSSASSTAASSRPQRVDADGRAIINLLCVVSRRGGSASSRLPLYSRPKARLDRLDWPVAVRMPAPVGAIARRGKMVDRRGIEKPRVVDEVGANEEGVDAIRGRPHERVAFGAAERGQRREASAEIVRLVPFVRGVLARHPAM